MSSRWLVFSSAAVVACSCHAISGLSDFDADGSAGAQPTASSGGGGTTTATSNGGGGATGGGGSSATSSSSTGGSGGAGGAICVTKIYGESDASEVSGVTADATMKHSCALENFGSSRELQVDGDEFPGAGGGFGTGGAGGAGGADLCPSGRAKNALLRFDLSTIPTSATLQSAKLTLTTDGSSGDGTPDTLAVNIVNQSWQEATVSWARRDFSTAWDQPGCLGNCLGAELGTFQPATPATSYDTLLNVSLLANWISTPSANLGMVLVNSTGTNGACFLSSENKDDTTKRPSLQVTYCE